MAADSTSFEVVRGNLVKPKRWREEREVQDELETKVDKLAALGMPEVSSWLRES